MLNLA